MTSMTAQPMTIIFSVTNDLTYDQRMHRICGSLAANGHAVTLVGRALSESIPLGNKAFGQKRLRCFFRKGFAFYAEFNLRLFFFLLFAKYDAVCSIDLDTLSAGCFASLLRGKKRVFDAHEYFTEVPEVVGRPFVKSFWEMVARICLPFYRHAYTVGPALAKIFEEKYNLKFGVVRNVASAPPSPPIRGGVASPPAPLLVERRVLPPPLWGGWGGLFYMGALNEGRGIETMLEAMQLLDDVHLHLAGEGDLSENLRRLAADLGVENKVTFLGYVPPSELQKLAAQAWLGLNLFENRGLSYYYSLANKFFGSVRAGVPVLTMNFPEYRALNAQHEVAILLDELTPRAMAAAVKNLLVNKDLYARLQKNCVAAREDWNWEKEEKVLLEIWRNVERGI
jgi:glycosyltransferase involved in cell wall biosynthesis